MGGTFVLLCERLAADSRDKDTDEMFAFTTYGKPQCCQMRLKGTRRLDGSDTDSPVLTQLLKNPVATIYVSLHSSFVEKCSRNLILLGPVPTVSARNLLSHETPTIS